MTNILISQDNHNELTSPRNNLASENTHWQFPAGYSQSVRSQYQSVRVKIAPKTPTQPIDNKHKSERTDCVPTAQSVQRDTSITSMGYDQSIKSVRPPLKDPPLLTTFGPSLGARANLFRSFQYSTTPVTPGPVHKAPGYEVALS